MPVNGLRFLSAAVVLAWVPAMASAAVIASAPVLLEPVPGAGGVDFSADVTLPADIATAMVGYDVAFSITGPTAGLTITGIDTRPASSVFLSDPTFSTHNSGGTTVYAFSDFLFSGNGTIAAGGDSTLFRLKFHAAAGTAGVFAVNFITDAASPYKSVLYANASLVPVATTFQAGSVTLGAAPVPEPASVAVLGVGGLLLLRRGRRVA